MSVSGETLPIPITPQRLRAMAVTQLRRQYRADRKLFAFRLRRQGSEVVLQGTSVRYTATVLIGLAGESDELAREVLQHASVADVYAACVDRLGDSPEPGELALVAWAGLLHGEPSAWPVGQHLWTLCNTLSLLPTVEASWALSALCSAPGEDPWRRRREQLARRLLDAVDARSGLFPHWLDGRGPWVRRHVACFADQVYPMLALSQYYEATGDPVALTAAERCAEQVVARQGSEGQWWWHFDVRTGRVVEPYPVYAVHQDAMAPMALRAVARASGTTFDPAIQRGLSWLTWSPEIHGSLIDPAQRVIWRKVARHEVGQCARRLQTLASRVHGRLRLPGLGYVCSPGRIDWETRPYHMGWILYAWPSRVRVPARPGEVIKARI